MTDQEYTELRTEVAEKLFLVDSGTPYLSFSDNAKYDKAADEIIDLINKRWQDWIEACGLEIKTKKRGLLNNDYLQTTRRYQDRIYDPFPDDPHRFSPLSKEK